MPATLLTCSPFLRCCLSQGIQPCAGRSGMFPAPNASSTTPCTQHCMVRGGSCHTDGLQSASCQLLPQQVHTLKGLNLESQLLWCWLC